MQTLFPHISYNILRVKKTKLTLFTPKMEERINRIRGKKKCTDVIKSPAVVLDFV